MIRNWQVNIAVHSAAKWLGISLSTWWQPKPGVNENYYFMLMRPLYQIINIVVFKGCFPVPKCPENQFNKDRSFERIGHDL